ncbi:hypothetical protein [Bradyrhizobium sp. NAS96.2]|uniref:hypothetical protein n=1 Tax=Bradyrhizobium sp. NAS96.2 TaxID=1680160 RepID=UPI00093FBB0A|nr:hypothetical protein [Bradyrhizobium sp. NAS96.2]OKO67260.1 hypothetical protein AC628_39795 [Bradyrhizobium sp. NAS96.2]
MAAPIAKSIGSNWSAGNNGGILDTGAAATGFYHIHLIKNPTTQAVDVLASLSATAPMLPAGYTLFRRIGSQWLGSGGLWLQLLQRGQEFWWPGVSLDVAVTNLGVALTNYTLASVPLGVQVQAILNVIGWSSSQNCIWVVHDKAMADVAPGYNAYGTGAEVTTVSSGNVTEIRVWTDTAQGIVARSTTANTTFRIATRGWFDLLGK